MILGLVAEAVEAGSRQKPACEILGLNERTLERWRANDIGDDKRQGPKMTPGNKLSEAERELVLEVVNSPEYRSLSPKQIVPLLADRGIYIASESTIYRILAEADQLAHRDLRKPRKHHKPTEYVAHGPLEVWSWDITYLRSAVRGEFYYLYLVVDIWSRKIVGWRVECTECMDYSSELIKAICAELGVDPAGIVLHSDNGGPMKGSTMLATLLALGIVASFSRPRVSDDNPYSESLFNTLKSRPWFPQQPFGSLEEARGWVSSFVDWYNGEHLHSSIGYVTPNDRHAGRDVDIVAKRREVFEQARRAHPERWNGDIRNLDRVEVVKLNPDAATNLTGEAHVAAA